MAMRETRCTSVRTDLTGTNRRRQWRAEKPSPHVAPHRQRLILITGSLFSVLPDRMDRRSSSPTSGEVVDPHMSTQTSPQRDRCWDSLNKYSLGSSIHIKLLIVCITMKYLTKSTEFPRVLPTRTIRRNGFHTWLLFFFISGFSYSESHETGTLCSLLVRVLKNLIIRDDWRKTYVERSVTRWQTSTSSKQHSEMWVCHETF